MTTRRALAAILACGLACAAQPLRADDAIDQEGFIRHWLILAPIDASDEAGDEAVDKEYVKGEANLAPKEGDKVKVGDKELTWKKHMANDYFIDLNEACGDRLSNVAGYAVCYVINAGPATKATLLIGSNDYSKTYLNGKEIAKNTEPRSTEKDQDTIPNVDLRSGPNVLVFKVINGENDWTGCARFVDKDEKPIKNLRISLSR